MRNNASILELSAASRLFSVSSCSNSLFSCFVRCSMSYTGRQLNVASKRRQGGNVETHSDLVRGLDGSEVEEVVIAVIRGERNKEQPGRAGTGNPWKPFSVSHNRSTATQCLGFFTGSPPSACGGHQLAGSSAAGPVVAIGFLS
ncbi:MAG: hypothetical protein WCK64_10865 [Synechococcaceae cyanobacterium ELA445]